MERKVEVYNDVPSLFLSEDAKKTVKWFLKIIFIKKSEEKYKSNICRKWKQESKMKVIFNFEKHNIYI